MKSLKVAAAIAGIFVSSAAFSQSLVKIDGSSTVFPITEAVAERENPENKERRRR